MHHEANIKKKNLPVWNVLVGLKISILLCKTKINDINLYYMIPKNCKCKNRKKLEPITAIG
jgi:hypothetical protein